MSRWVIVDDTDAGLSYIGPWFQSQGTQNGLGSYGPPLLGSLHGTNSDASFSYSFYGSAVRIMGTNQWVNPAGVTNPSWQCIVDGVSLPSTTLSPSTPENRLLFCEEDGLSNGLHVITMNVTVSNQKTFWFDYIQYLPSPSMSLDQPASFFIEAGDSQFQYGTGWSPKFPGNMTGQFGSTFSFEFNGTSLTWFGFYENRVPLAATTATYAIDGQSPTSFNLNGASPEGTGALYNQIFFQTDQLSSGWHRLDVVYQGSSQTTPLTLSELFLQNNASPTLLPSMILTGLPISTSTSTTTNEIPSPSFNPAHHSSNLGPIIGGVIGGLALIIFAILAIFFLRRRNNLSQEKAVILEPFLNPSMVGFSPHTQHFSSNNFHSNLRHSRDLSGQESTPSLSLPPLTPNRRISATRMIQMTPQRSTS